MMKNTDNTTTAARLAFEMIPAENLPATLESVFNHCRRRADVYHIKAEIFDQLTPDDVTAAAYIAAAAALDQIDAAPADDPRRAWPLTRVLVRAMCDAIRKTYRAEHGNPSALVYLDALDDDEQRAAVIDTAARANGAAPTPPESAYIMRETVADALRETCRDDIDAAIIRATAAGFTQSEIGTALNISHQAVSLRLKKIQSRAAAYQIEQAEQEKRNAAARLADFGDKYAAAERISGAKPADK